MSEKQKHRNESKKGLKEYIALGAVVLVAAGVSGYRHITEPGNHKVTEIVKANDNPYTLAKRAEDQFGKDVADYNVQNEALKIDKDHGTLHAGEKVEVDVK